MIDVRQVTAGYNGAPVLHDVSARVERGEIVALAGRNASGKSTLLKAIMGLLVPSAGKITFSGQDLRELGPRQRVRLGIGYMPQGGRLFPDLTLEENIQVYLGSRYSYDAMFDHMFHWTVPNEVRGGGVFTKMLQLLGRHRERARNLSGGEKQLVSIARTLLRPSAFVLLDEPSIGLSRALLSEVGAILASFAAKGVGILVVDQNVEWLLTLSNRIYVMHQGRITTVGESRKFAGDKTLLYRGLGLTE